MLARLHARVAERFGDDRPPPDALAERLAHALHSARAAWPSLALPDEDFLAHLVERLPSDSAPLDSLARAKAGDLYLALACARGMPEALREFDAAHGEELRQLAARESTRDADDVVQLVRERLFTGDAPRIAEYAGQGDLRRWLRVTVTRLVIDVGRKRSEAPPAEPDALVLALPDPSDDPEIAYLKRHYSDEFRAAFEAAVGGLSPAERNVLRWYYVQGLGIDQIAATRGMHRATAARQVQRAREALLAATRRRLGERLGLGESELESVMRMIESQVQVSVRRVLDLDDEVPAG